MADLIRKFLNRPITFKSDRMADSNSNRISKLCRSLIHTIHVQLCFTISEVAANWHELKYETGGCSLND